MTGSTAPSRPPGGPPPPGPHHPSGSDRAPGARVRPFLTASWRHLLMLNYPVDPALLRPLVPAGTELDSFRGVTHISMVGFLFLDTRVMGVPVPGHRDFEEVNLRFYVRRRAPDGWRRGVVFVRELVPRRAIAWIARRVYGEPYLAVPMSHRADVGPRGYVGVGGRVAYAWRFQDRWHRMSAVVHTEPRLAEEGSEPHFITEHYWGYTARADGTSAEYQVTHPRWRVSTLRDAKLDIDAAALYGRDFADALSAAPVSAFLADGSPISVLRMSTIHQTHTQIAFAPKVTEVRAPQPSSANTAARID